MQRQSQQTRKISLTEQLDRELKKCGLTRRQFPQSPRNLFKAISDSLYFDQRYFDQLVDLCKHELKRKIDNNSLPSKLNQQFENRALVDDYYDNPDLNGFIKVHLGLISLAYDRKIVVYHISENYLTSMTVNNSSNKRPPILLCRVLNSYSAVLTQETTNVAEMIKQRICQKLMAHSFLISTKPNDQKIAKLFETIKRPHKKSLSLCDELEYQQIFGAAINFSFQNQGHSNRFIQFDSNSDEKQDLDLLGECNINGKVEYPVLAQKSRYDLSPSHYHRAESMRVISANIVRKDTTQISGVNRQTGRLKFFDQNKNYGFIIMDEDNSDIFVHHDDLSKAGMTKEYMRNTKHGHIIRFQFSSMTYIGKYDKSRKAVDLVVIEATEYALF